MSLKDQFDVLSKCFLEMDEPDRKKISDDIMARAIDDESSVAIAITRCLVDKGVTTADEFKVYRAQAVFAMHTATMAALLSGDAQDINRGLDRFLATGDAAEPSWATKETAPSNLRPGPWPGSGAPAAPEPSPEK